MLYLMILNHFIIIKVDFTLKSKFYHNNTKLIPIKFIKLCTAEPIYKQINIKSTLLHLSILN